MNEIVSKDLQKSLKLNTLLVKRIIPFKLGARLTIFRSISTPISATFFLVAMGIFSRLLAICVNGIPSSKVSTMMLEWQSSVIGTGKTILEFPLKSLVN